MPDIEKETFCMKMRNATRDIHTISDGLVNAKLVVGFSNNSVWADGLLVFYEIFRYLEGAMLRWKNTKLGLSLLPDLQRTEAFERDLEYYLGKGWKENYTPRSSVIKYLTHLRNIEDTDPILLIAYIYHLYMGLLSGGTILRKKRLLAQKFRPFTNAVTDGNYITEFNDSIYHLKQNLRSTINNIANTLDEDTKNRLILESRTVYALNNDLIRSVQGANSVVAKKLMYFAGIIFLFFVYVIFFK